MESRKAFTPSKTADVDKVLLDWLRQLQSDKCLHNCSIVMGQAEVFHAELGLPTLCEYFSGWFNIFEQ
jgi:hypothetical protein